MKLANLRKKTHSGNQKTYVAAIPAVGTEELVAAIFREPTCSKKILDGLEADLEATYVGKSGEQIFSALDKKYKFNNRIGLELELENLSLKVMGPAD